MARKKSGGFFSKALEFIGLVDEEDPQDYEEEYQDDYGTAGDPYGYDAPARKQEPRRAAASARETARQPRTSARQTASARTSARQSGYQPRSYGEEYSAEQPASRRGGYEGYSERSASRASARPSYGATTRAQGARYSYENMRRAAPEAPAAPKKEAPRPAASRHPRTVMYSMRSFEDCREVIHHLLSGNTVVLTLEEMDSSITQRALDTLSGAVFALSASIRRASDNTYLLAPGTVEVNEVYEEDREY